MTDLDALLVLNAIPGLRNDRVKKLIDYLASAEKILELNKRQFTNLPHECSLPLKAIENILKFPKDRFLKTEYNLVQSFGIHVLAYQDDAYPWLLSQIPDSPNVLYVRGDVAKLPNPSVAMVGSRKASIYGLTVAEKFAMFLAERGLNIISGMAKGIDTACHHAVQRVNGTTVAVLGCGLSITYPLENKILSNAIAREGALVSEFPMETPPIAYNFPRRNRIISGLSLGVVVVEASQKSGALITSDFALEQGREVFAIPGKIDQPSAQGVNRLIREGATLVTSPEDVWNELEEKLANYPAQKESRETKGELQNRRLTELQSTHESGATTPQSLTAEEKLVYQQIPINDSIDLDGLALNCRISVSSLAMALLNLELKSKIRQIPGKKFVRNS